MVRPGRGGRLRRVASGAWAMLERLDGRGARAEGLGAAGDAAAAARARLAAHGTPAREGLALARGVLGSAAHSVGYGYGYGGGAGGAAARGAPDGLLRELLAELGARAARDPEGLGGLLGAAFGARAEGFAGWALAARLAAGDVPRPALRVVGGETLPAGARGAYSAEGGGTVFVHRELLGDPAALRAVLAEELGHHLDRQLGPGDAAGDEGVVFARLVAGERPGRGELAALRAEDDRGRLRDGRAVEFDLSLGTPGQRDGTARGGATVSSGSGSSGGVSADGRNPSDTPGERDGTTRGGAKVSGGSGSSSSHGSSSSGLPGERDGTARGGATVGGARGSDDDEGTAAARRGGADAAAGGTWPASGGGGTDPARGPAFEREGRGEAPSGSGSGFGSGDGAQPDPAAAAMVDQAIGIVAQGLGVGLDAVGELARATARGLGTAAAVARGDPSAVLEAIEAVAGAVAGAVQAAPAGAAGLGEVVERAVRWADDAGATRARTTTAACPPRPSGAGGWPRWAGLPLEAGLATVARGVELARSIPAARTPLARELARGVAGGAAEGAFADRALELALELDARAAVEAFGAGGRGGRLGDLLAGQGLRARERALGAIAEGSLTGLDRTGALTAMLRETRIEHDLNGRDGRGGVAQDEQRPARLAGRGAGGRAPAGARRARAARQRWDRSRTRSATARCGASSRASTPWAGTGKRPWSASWPPTPRRWWRRARAEKRGEVSRGGKDDGAHDAGGKRAQSDDPEDAVPFASTPRNRAARWDEAQAIRGADAQTSGATSLHPSDPRALDYPFHSASPESRRGEMRTGGVPGADDPHRRTGWGALGAYADSHVGQVMSGVNEGIANVLGGAVDLMELGLNGAMWSAERAGVPESWTPEFGGSFGGSESIKAALGWAGSIAPESADPAKRTARDVAEMGTEVASVLTGAALAARGISATGALDDMAKGVADDVPPAPTQGGAARRAQHGGGWQVGDLRSSIDRFAGAHPRVTTTDTGKRIYENPETGIQVVQDLQGQYYRILDTNLPGRRRYLDLDGKVPNNAIVDGRQVGRSQAEYNQATHFKIEP